MKIEPEKCRVTGKNMFNTKAEALTHEQSRFGFTAKPGHWKTIRCIFCDHVHLTKNGPGDSRRGKKDRQKVTRGKR